MYIRTKDRIIDLNRKRMDGTPIYNLDTKENVIKACKNEEERDCYYIENDTIYDYCFFDGCIWENHIIKQSDNLAELCDEFVFYHCIGNPFLYTGSKQRLKEYYLTKKYAKICKENDDFFYGAVWTLKGLKYVAKMDDNGELVLL